MTIHESVSPPGATARRGALRRVRAAAAWLCVALAMAIAAAVFAQVYLIGAYVFGAGQGALDAHRSVGFTVHGLELLLLVAALVAWLPRADLALAALLAVVGTVQIALASATEWAGGLHPLGALFVLVLAAQIARRRLRARAGGAPAPDLAVPGAGGETAPAP